jgi:hypothetical protein
MVAFRQRKRTLGPQRSAAAVLSRTPASCASAPVRFLLLQFLASPDLVFAKHVVVNRGNAPDADAALELARSNSEARKPGTLMASWLLNSLVSPVGDIRISYLSA